MNHTIPMHEGSQLQLFVAEGEASTQGPQWSVRVSKRARRLAVRVSPEGRVEIVAPAGTGSRRVQSFVAEHREWIARRLRDFERASPMRERGLPERLELPALGRTVAVEYRVGGPRLRIQPSRDRDMIRVEAAGATDDQMARELRRWLAGYAKPQISDRLDSLATVTGLEYSRMQLRCQRTRWGSCSVRGTISINVCIAFLPQELLRYLLLHELCHTREMNHSQRFWALVGRHEPAYRRLDRELAAGWRAVPGWVFR